MKKIYTLAFGIVLSGSVAMAQTEKKLIQIKYGADETNITYQPDGKIRSYTQVDNAGTAQEETTTSTFTYTATQIVMKSISSNTPTLQDTWTSTLKNGLIVKDLVNINGNADNYLFEYTYDTQRQLVGIKRTNSQSSSVTLVDITWHNGDITAVKTTQDGRLLSEERYEYDTANDNNAIRSFFSPVSNQISFENLSPAGSLLAGAYGTPCRHLYTTCYEKVYSHPAPVQEEKSEERTFTRNAEGLITHLSQLLKDDPQSNEYDLIWTSVATHISANETASSVPTEYYDLGGIRLPQPGRGLHIVRDGRGTVKKILQLF